MGLFNKIFRNKSTISNDSDIGKLSKESNCPYCGFTFDKSPSRKKKCPQCNNYVYIRSGLLLTEEDKNKVDWLKRVTYLGITNDMFLEHYHLLSNQFGKKPSINDTAWSILNSLVVKNISDSNKSSIYYEMAHVVISEGKNPKPFLIQASKYSLLVMKNAGINKVKIYNVNDDIVCERCKQIEGKIFTIDQALNELPVPTLCENITGCRCSYAPVYESNEEEFIKIIDDILNSDYE